MNRLIPVACLLAIAAAGCSGPTHTIRELGHPAFEEVVGASTRYERPAPKERNGLNAFTEGVDDDAKHLLEMRFLPVATKEKIGLEIKARPMAGLRLRTMAAAVFAVSRQEGQAFVARGALPAPEQPILVQTKFKQDKQGWMVVQLIFKRSAVPPGKELAVPALVQFTDGWIYVRFYRTGVPAPMKFRPIVPGKKKPGKGSVKKPGQAPVKKPGKPAQPPKK